MVRRRGWPLLVCAVLVLLAACTGGGTRAPRAAGSGAPDACQVRYVLRAVPTGFTADVTVTTSGPRVEAPTVAFPLASPGRLADGWNATWSQSAGQVSAALPGVLEPGSAVTVGFDATGTPGPEPGRFTLNGVACTADVSADTTLPATTSRAPSLRVSGNRIVDQSGQPAELFGVNRSGGEYSCVTGNSIWDGPVDDTALQAIAAWNVKAVRVPLNEDCWLSRNGVRANLSGARYRAAVVALVAGLEARGMVPILDLHWSDGVWTGAESQCGSDAARCQKPVPDTVAVTFWRSVAQTFASDQSVIFDLFNEPYAADIGTMPRSQSWNCWLSGGPACRGLGYQAAGMQQLVDAVRAAGAHNVVLASADSYARDLAGWLAHAPKDPTGNLAAAWHWYPDGYCPDSGCWQRQVGELAARVPVVATEIGEMDCATTQVVPLMNWLDQLGVNYLAWTWNVWGCGDGNGLIDNYSGDPTPYGLGVQAHFRQR
jgi:endoglucanase